MPETSRPQNRRTRPAPPEESFRPHQRYPRLNANAGVDEARPAGRGRRPARRAATGGRAASPRANIRLDSMAHAPRMTVRRVGPGASPRSQAASGFKGGRWLSIGALFGLMLLGYWLLNSSTFYISKIEVKGSRFLNSQEVVKVTGVDRINVFVLNEADLARKIQALPYVLEARVTKSIPDRLTVEVTERKSVVNWKIGSLNYLVDQEGVVLDALLDQDLPAGARAFTVIQSLDERKLSMGERVDGGAVRSAQTIQEQLGQAGIKLAEVQYSSTNGLMVLSAPEAGNWKALLGTDAQLEKKINILKGLLADKAIKWTYADLRFVNKPAIQ